MNLVSISICSINGSNEKSFMQHRYFERTITQSNTYSAVKYAHITSTGLLANVSMTNNTSMLFYKFQYK